MAPSFREIHIQHQVSVRFIFSTKFPWNSSSAPSFREIHLQHQVSVRFIFSTKFSWDSSSTPSFREIHLQHQVSVRFIFSTKFPWDSSSAPTLVCSSKIYHLTGTSHEHFQIYIHILSRNITPRPTTNKESQQTSMPCRTEKIRAKVSKYNNSNHH